MVGARGEGREEAALVHIGSEDRPAAVVHEPSPGVPRRVAQLILEAGAERCNGDRDCRCQAGAGDPRGAGEQPPPREARDRARRLGVHGCRLLGVPVAGAVLDLRLLGHEPAAGEHERRGQQPERKAEREAEQLRVRVEHEQRHEAQSREARSAEQGEHEELRPRGDEIALAIAHAVSLPSRSGEGGASSVRSPSRRAISSSAAAASSHATMPSGIGPMRPRPQPPLF